MVADYSKEIISLSKKLNLENRTYFDKLHRYLGTAGFFYDEKEVQLQIYQLVSDLYEAQKNGETAVSFLGDDPKKMANELIHSFQKKSSARLYRFMGAMGIIGCLGYFFASYSFNNPLRINLWELVMIFLITMLGVYLFFKILHFTIYDTKSKVINFLKNSKVLGFIAQVLIIDIILLGIGLLFVFGLPKNMIWEVPNSIATGGILLVMFITSIIIFLKKEKISYPFIILIWLIPLGGILRRIDSFKPYFDASYGYWLNLILIFLPYILFTIALAQTIKRLNLK